LAVPNQTSSFSRTRNHRLIALHLDIAHVAIKVRRSFGATGVRFSRFPLMSRNAQSASSFYRIPPNRVVELGAQMEF